MKVWQLRRCEEYWMQEDHGLFATRERAIQAIPNVLHLIDDIIISWEKDHYSKPDGTLTREKAEAILNKDGYSFYNLDHNGYSVWGVREVEVIE